MTSRLSYASSPESDLELSPGAAPRLVKASSDPSVATAQDNGDRDDLNLADALPPPYSVSIGIILTYRYIFKYYEVPTLSKCFDSQVM